MELALITVKQVVVLFILIFAGFVCVKTKAVKMEGKKAFSDLLLYLIVPAMVINSYMMEFNIDILHNLLKAFELSILLLLIGLFITLALTAKHKSPDLPIMRFACIFSNAAYMGFPLIQALFGSEGLLYASAFVTVYNILLWTAGYGIVSKKVHAKEVLRTIFTNPVLISVVAGLLIYLCQIPVPDIIKQPVSLVGNMNTPLAMIIAGANLAQGNLLKSLQNKRLYLICSVKLILYPLVGLAALWLLHLEFHIAFTVFIGMACPAGASAIMFAERYGKDAKYASEIFVVTTVLSAVSIPVLSVLAIRLLGAA